MLRIINICDMLLFVNKTDMLTNAYISRPPRAIL